MLVSAGNLRSVGAGMGRMLLLPEPRPLDRRLERKFSHLVNPFERRVIEAELESLRRFSAKKNDAVADRWQMASL